jgi:hypothetical protein
MNKKIYKVKFEFYTEQVLQKLKTPCFSKDYGDFFFNWSLETANQFSKHLLNMTPTKYYISSATEIEAITLKKDIFQKIMDNYNKVDNSKIDKLELVSVIPFIVDNDYDNSLKSSLSLFCFENENEDLITKNEFGLFIDSYLRCLHHILIVDNDEEIYEKTKGNIVKIADSELDDILGKIFKEAEQLPLDKAIR